MVDHSPGSGEAAAMPDPMEAGLIETTVRWQDARATMRRVRRVPSRAIAPRPAVYLY